MTHRFLNRKETMLIAAIDLLDRSGVQGLTAREIARVEGLTEAAVYRHFKGKKEILEGIIRRFASYDEKIGSTMRQQVMTEEQGLLYYAETYAANYQGYPQLVTLLFSFDVYRYDPPLKALMQGTMDKRRSFLEQFIRQCRTEGRGSGTMEPALLSDMVLGCILNSAYYWKLSDCSTDFKAHVLTAVGILLERNRCAAHGDGTGCS